MDTPQAAPKHEDVTNLQVAFSWLGLVLMMWGIVCAFKPYICGVVLGVIGVALYIKAVKAIHAPTRDLVREATNGGEVIE
jgi:uncharacterized protein YqgC (DUF456 family)